MISVVSRRVPMQNVELIKKTKKWRNEDLRIVKKKIHILLQKKILALLCSTEQTMT